MRSNLEARLSRLEAAFIKQPLVLACQDEPDAAQQTEINNALARRQRVVLFRSKGDTVRIYHEGSTYEP